MSGNRDLFFCYCTFTISDTAAGAPAAMDELEILAELQALDLLPAGGDRQRAPARNRRAINRRLDPIAALSDAVFKSHFRFDKDSVLRLVEILNLGSMNNHGRPLTPVQQVCLGLNFYVGGLASLGFAVEFPKKLLGWRLKG